MGEMAFTQKGSNPYLKSPDIKVKILCACQLRLDGGRIKDRSRRNIPHYRFQNSFEHPATSTPSGLNFYKEKNDCSVITSGSCTSDSGMEYTFTNNTPTTEDDRTFLVSNTKMSWWAAKNWCALRKKVGD